MSTPTVNSVSVSTISLSGSNTIDSLIFGSKWGSGLGAGVSLTYSFPAALSSYWYAIDYPQYSAEPWQATAVLNSAAQSAAISALATWSNVANITFTQVGDNISTVGEIRFQWTSPTVSNDGQAWAYYPSSTPKAGDVWLNWTAGDTGNFSAGSYWYDTLIHELGHALGLKHTFQSGGISSAVLPSNADGYHYSIMSYSAKTGVSGSTVTFNPTTPMFYDIAAIQYLYGANQ
jgi:serralysin